MRINHSTHRQNSRSVMYVQHGEPSDGRELPRMMPPPPQVFADNHGGGRGSAQFFVTFRRCRQKKTGELRPHGFWNNATNAWQMHALWVARCLTAMGPMQVTASAPLVNVNLL